MNVAHFYHVWADGRWSTPVAEHCKALILSAFEGPVTVGIVGGKFSREDVWRRVCRSLSPAGLLEAQHGFEALTINAVRDYAQEHDGAVMYAHTKGAWTVSPFRDRWRRAMCLRVVSRWRQNVAYLEDHDAVGCHWLSARAFPGAINTPFFGGNYWMATCEYLRTLPECGDENRFDAECWIGLNNPRVVDLCPGWPGEDRWPEQQV